MDILAGSPALRDLLLKGQRFSRAKGQIFQNSEDGTKFNFIKSGYVKRYLIANDGSLGVELMYGPDDVFPIALVFKAVFGHDINKSPETHYYEAMTDCVLYSVDVPTVMEMIKKDPMIYRGLFRETGRRLQTAMHGLENVTLSNSYHRVAHELLFLGRSFGEVKDKGLRISVPLTHQDIANNLSLTRETVSNNMSELRKRGLIKTGRHIFIPDMKKLEKEAYT